MNAKDWNPKVGDTVQLRSGGMTMTVVDVDKNNVSVLWMCTDGDLADDVLVKDCLVPVTYDAMEKRWRTPAELR